MGLYTSSYLKGLSESTLSIKKSKLFSESKNRTEEFDIFLSHSFLDKDEVEGLFIELTNMGFSVYVDWIVDPHLDRNNVTKETAELIRKRMKSSKTLLLAISTNAQMSKWMPWELGFVDGKTNQCALIPVTKDNFESRTFNRSEYLLLYPYLKLARINFAIEQFITESAYTYVSLENWVKKNAKPTYNATNINEL